MHGVSHVTVLHPHVQSLGGLGDRSQTHTSRRSIGQVPRTVITAADRLSWVEEHASKRRKTCGGISSRGTSAATPPARVSSSQSQSLKASPVVEAPRNVSSRPAAILPPIKNGHRYSQLGSQTPVFSFGGRHSGATPHRTSNAERLRADSLRKPLNSVISNKQSVPHHAESRSQRQAAYYIIQNQVIVHVESILEEYRQGISKESRASLGSRVSSNLISLHLYHIETF